MGVGFLLLVAAGILALFGMKFSTRATWARVAEIDRQRAEQRERCERIRQALLGPNPKP